ncbi:N-acetylmuramoyl-L-alanine amidase LytC precursor [Clostridium ragsdalei P11]|uniref:N-acetylmuramoyl-L-alanine amidase LytC n=1 Tax=Clostridium ragsdalei P11 TaxID=1353534 RepID=A0A1A6AMY4_9CLOT|nr:cell wall-binding repeat-containing protein [Clostridium ragsdalei]OBR91420.1 N-acetylmuramoyl-L-alanine amidase LytC precursor [Clostridium ragsdalei P11]
MKSVKLITIAFLTFLIAVSPCIILQPNKVKAASSQIEDITRMGGANRFETSVKIAKQGWAHSDNVVLADAQGNDAFADAISGTSLAYYLDCPILLTNTNDTPNVVKDEISQLKAKNIYILGGTGVISNSQEENLKSNGYNVTRIAGSSRFDTACKAADILNSKSKIEKVYIAPADKFQYPLIAAPYAARENGVVLFTSGNDINEITKNEILKLGVKDVSIVGSYNIVSYDAEAQLESLGINCFRMHGTTPQGIASDFINVNGNNSNGVSIASSKMFPDALSGSVLTAKNNYNILLVDDGVRYTLNNNVKHAFIFGGREAVSDNLENYIKSAENSKDLAVTDALVPLSAETAGYTIDTSYMPIYDQGRSPRCFPYAICNALEIKNYQETGKFVPYDQSLICKGMSKDIPFGDYSTPGAALKSMIDISAVDDSDRTRLLAVEQIDWRLEEKLHDGYKKIIPEGMNQTKAWLSEGKPAVLAVRDLYKRFGEYKSGIYDGAEDSNHPGGGHALVATGFDNAKGEIKILNSYGKEWGMGGYGYISDKATTNIRAAWIMLGYNDIPTLKVSDDRTEYKVIIPSLEYISYYTEGLGNVRAIAKLYKGQTVKAYKYDGTNTYDNLDTPSKHTAITIQ